MVTSLRRLYCRRGGGIRGAFADGHKWRPSFDPAKQPFSKVPGSVGARDSRSHQACLKSDPAPLRGLFRSQLASWRGKSRGLLPPGTSQIRPDQRSGPPFRCPPIGVKSVLVVAEKVTTLGGSSRGRSVLRGRRSAAGPVSDTRPSVADGAP